MGHLGRTLLHFLLHAIAVDYADNLRAVTNRRNRCYFQ
jgi:hypothetical protein